MKNIYNRFVLALTGTVLAITGFAQTTVPSIITSDQTWNAAGSPYQVNANTLISENVTVTVLPGTVIESPTDKIRIIVDGQLTAIGKSDSAITMNKITFDFTKKSIDYDSSSGTGSQFQYCLFNGTGSSAGTKTINLNETGILIRNCKFIDGYYYIYGYSYADSTNVYIEKCVFRGVTTNYGYPIYNSSSSNMLYFTDCYTENMSGVFLGKYSTIERSTFKNYGGSSAIRKSNSCAYLNIECNLFQNFKYDIIDISYMATGSYLNIQYNTFDSADLFIQGSVSSSFKPTSTVIKNNNFLAFRKNSIAYRSGSTPGVADTINFQQNFWGTTTSSTISDGIKDFNDDITISGFIDFTNMLTTKVTSCSGGGAIGDADTSSSQGHVTVVNMTVQDFTVYPNPASDIVNVEVSGKDISTVKVYDVSGKLVQYAQLKDSGASINVSILQNGAYVIEVECEGNVLRKRFMVSH